MKRALTLLRALFAAAIAIAIVIAVPFFLSRFGWPWTDLANTLSEQVASDNERIEAILTLALTALAWAAWAMFVVALFAEALASRRRSLARRLPIAPGIQSFAAWLLAALTLAAASMTSSPDPVAAAPLTPVAVDVSQPAATVISTATSPTAHEAAASHQTYEVRSGDTLWGIAETLLGDGVRWADIAHLNDGATMTDGTIFRAATVQRPTPGWVLAVPDDAVLEAKTPDAAETVTVERGDTLWDLAEEHLGDPFRYTDIHEANLDQIQNPNLIYPGQVLDIPTAATVAPAPAPAPPPPVESDRVPDLPPPTPDPATEPAPSQAETPPPAPVDSTASRAETSAPSEVVTERGDSAAGLLSSIPAGLAVGGITTAGVVAMIDRFRRARRKDRARGMTVPPPPPRVEIAEVALRAGAHVDRATYLAAAVRALAANLITGLPALSHLQVDDTEVRVYLAAPTDNHEPPQGWVQRDGAWITSEPVDWLIEQAPGALDPLPLLCPVGTTSGGAEVLIDLESAGVVTLHGDSEGRHGLLRAMAMNASTAEWAAGLRVMLAGFEGTITALPNVETVDLAATGIEAAAAHTEVVYETLATMRCRSVVQARMSGVTPSMLGDTLVVMSAQPAGETHFQAATGLEDAGVAVVTVTDHDCDFGVSLHVDNDGMLTCDRLPVPIRASYLADDDLVRLGEVLDHANSEATIPVSTEPPLRNTITPSLATGGDLAGSQDTLASQILAEADVIVKVMGDVRVETSLGEPIDFGYAKAEETVVYLAAAGGAVDNEILESRLWPDGANSPKTRNNVISKARKVLGLDRDGRALLPPAPQGVLELSPRIVTDFEMFWQLHELARETADEIESARILDQALRLVIGEPFTGRGREYAWRSASVSQIVVRIVDAAYVAGEIFLATDDPEATQRICRAGLRAAPTEECLYQLMMKAAHQAGSIAGIRRLYRELADVLADPDNGTEPEASISSATVELYESLLASA